MKDILQYEGRNIRRTWYNDEWFFCIADIISIFANSSNPRQYWKNLKRRDSELQKSILIEALLLPTSGGLQKGQCTNRFGILRLMQSIPSPEAEPFKQWMAELGNTVMEETEQYKALIDKYRQLGYSERWIKARLRSQETRKLLTNEWQNRDIKDGRQFAELTDVIHEGTFGVTTREHKGVKDLKKKDNLRDNMTYLELGFNIIGEASTLNEISENDPQGFNENKECAVKGGQNAGAARKAYEETSGKKVVSGWSFKKYLQGNNLKDKDDKKEE